MPSIKTFIVDAFTDEQFKGNPAGVCLLEQPLSDELMLSIAQELNLSETAFIQAIVPEQKYSIRYFSPKMEIPLCGHATLASSKVLFELFDINNIHFVNIQQIDLLISREANNIIMEFPVYNTKPADPPQALLDALGIQKTINSCHNAETNILLVEIDSTQILKALTPDFQALYQSIDSINGVLVTAPSKTDEYDFHSRYFWPWSGSNEDPVTGGTHTFLAKYWGDRLNKTKMKSFQSSKRTGFMDVELVSDDQFLIKSQAVIVFEGLLRL